MAIDVKRDHVYAVHNVPTSFLFCFLSIAKIVVFVVVWGEQGMEWRKALALLVRMQHDEIQPNLHCMNAAINAVGLSGEWQRAEAMMEVIHKSGLQADLVSYNSVAMAYASVSCCCYCCCFCCSWWWW